MILNVFLIEMICVIWIYQVSKYVTRLVEALDLEWERC